MANIVSEYLDFDMQERCSTAIQPINGTMNVCTDYEIPRDEETHNDNIYQEPPNSNTNRDLPEAPNMGQHQTNIPTNGGTARVEVSETSPNKRMFVCLIGLSFGVIVALALAAFCTVFIIKIHLQTDGDGVSNNTIFSATMTKQQKGTGSSSYIRWGRAGCPHETADIAYTGYAAGSDYINNDGSGSNYLCLHETPEYDSHVPYFDSSRARISGVEYQVSSFPPFASQHNHDMNCAVCRVATRGTMIMIPARMTCPSGWTREYFGYLMSSRRDRKRTEYICVDRDPESVSGTHESENGAIVYPVEVVCLDPDPVIKNGGLPCNKFPDGNELSCVVCTK